MVEISYDDYEAYKGVYYGVYKDGEKNKGEKAEVEAIRRQAEESELANKLYNEKKLSSEKIIFYLKPYSNDLRRGITRPKLSNLLGITENECKIILNKLISDGKAYKRFRFFKYSKYYVE